MADDELTLLRDHFHFYAHPFVPAVDTVRSFDFDQHGVSLMDALRMFEYDALEAYYTRVAPFAGALQAADDALKASGFPRPGPRPVILVYGPEGAGRSSLIEYVAGQFQKCWRAKNPSGHKAVKETIEIEGDNLGRLLFAIRREVRAVADAYEVKDALKIFDKYGEAGGEKEPNETTLLTLLGALTQAMRKAPPLILEIKGVPRDQAGWVKRVGGLVSELNVIPIFVTNNDTTFGLAKATKPPPIALEVGQLSRIEFHDFLVARLDLFRLASRPEDRGGIYPFTQDAFDTAFKGYPSGHPIKFLLRMFRQTFDQKLNALNAGESRTPAGEVRPEIIQVTGVDVGDGLRSLIAPAEQRGGS